MVKAFQTMEEYCDDVGPSWLCWFSLVVLLTLLIAGIVYSVVCEHKRHAQAIQVAVTCPEVKQGIKLVNEIRCLECDLRYEVVWHYDGCEPPVGYCPRCGSQDLELPRDPEEETL